MLAESTVEMDTIVCAEKYGSTSVERSYCVSVQKAKDSPLIVKEQSENWKSVNQFFRSILLPQGYPESVSRDYMQYQIWDTIQAFSSSITGTLATQAVLQGVGVGDENATILAATLTWLMKDGTGMVGRILFAWLKGTYLDCDCKRWRLFADFLNDAAIFLELMAPHFKQFFRVIICISGVSKSIVGVAGGATRAAVTQHQARRNNSADVSAKDGSQETLVGLMGLLTSLVLIPLVTGNHIVIWILYVLFTWLHLFANYRAVTALTMESFNQTRLHLLVKGYLTSNCTHVDNVDDINKLEPVIFAQKRNLSIHIGEPLSRLVAMHEDLQKILQIYSRENYLLHFDMKKKAVYICLHDSATSLDQLKACFLAEVIEHAFQLVKIKQVSESHADIKRICHALQNGDVWSTLSRSQEFTALVFTRFCEQARRRGWEPSKTLLCTDEWRAEWNPDRIQLDKKGF